MRLEDDSLKALQDGNELRNSPQEPESNNSMEPVDNCGNISAEGDEAEDITSQIGESADSSFMDDNSSEQSWMLRSLSDSSVACITSDFAMQNVLLQMGLRLLAPGGMQIHELHSFSLPMPQGGRDAITKNPVLREDQLPQKFLYPKTKKKGKEGDDIFATNHIFLHHTDKRAPLQPPVRQALSVFSGKRNPNDNHYSRSKH